MDVREGLPKAVAAQKRLAEINTSINLIGRTESLNAGNIKSLLDGVHFIIDGTDNVETRYLLNDYSVKYRVPWVYGGAIGTTGTGLFIMPGEGPCLRCVFPIPPESGKLGTCDTIGILGTVPVIVGAWQASMAIRYLVGHKRDLGEKLLMMDLWEHGFLEPGVKRKKDCPACGKGEFPFLTSRRRTTVVNLCGTQAFQVTPPQRKDLDLEAVSRKLTGLGEVDLGPYYLRFLEGNVQMILYPGGRAQISGVANNKEALSFYSRYVGL
jgi:adenylyltransferase/sulfurtransferase